MNDWKEYEVRYRGECGGRKVRAADAEHAGQVFAEEENQQDTLRLVLTVVDDKKKAVDVTVRGEPHIKWTSATEIV